MNGALVRQIRDSLKQLAHGVVRRAIEITQETVHHELPDNFNREGVLSDDFILKQQLLAKS